MNETWCELCQIFHRHSPVVEKELANERAAREQVEARLEAAEARAERRPDDVIASSEFVARQVDATDPHLTAKMGRPLARIGGVLMGLPPSAIGRRVRVEVRLVASTEQGNETNPATIVSLPCREAAIEAAAYRTGLKAVVSWDEARRGVYPDDRTHVPCPISKLFDRCADIINDTKGPSTTILVMCDAAVRWRRAKTIADRNPGRLLSSSLDGEGAEKIMEELFAAEAALREATTAYLTLSGAAP